MKKLLNYIGGEFVEPLTQKFFESYNPALGQPHLLVADSDGPDINRAVTHAKIAFPAWSALTINERAKFLYRIADLIDQRVDEFALAESEDQGKPLWLAKTVDIPRASHNFRFFAGAALHRQDVASRLDKETLSYVAHEPVGVAGLISPWNLPLYLLTWKIAPAIAYGNTCVAKPSEFTSLTASLLCEVMRDAGLPNGVVNVVFGTGPKAGAPLVEHEDVRLISFTGGTTTGRAIAIAAAPQFKKLSLELGGKNPNILFDDCDFEDALKTTIRSSFLNQGEICLCGPRIYVQRGIYEKFLERFKAETKKLVVGDPLKRNTFIGPLVSKQHLEKVQSYISHARELGLKFEAGDEPLDLDQEHKDGYFMRPTILSGGKEDCRIQQEEIFGPVVHVTPFDTEEEVLGYANGVTYGLSASIWTSDLRRAHSMADKIEAGTVWVNTWMKRDLRVPFGGVKGSGVGREGQDGSLEFFTEAKTICVRHK
jgi:aminomuconate-semialdehyde/2-hydroxymuconate-6-semialdehyde dehydrogenase